MSRRKTAQPVTEEAKPIEAEPVQAVEPKPEPKPEKPAEPLIYIGPSLRNGQLIRSTVFKAGKLPAHVQYLIDDCTALKSLFVPVSKLAQAEAKLTQKASVERARYEEARKHFSKGAN